MSPDEATKAVTTGARVRLYPSHNKADTIAEGNIVSYSIVPVIAIRLDDGSTMSWRHDLAEIIDSHEQAIRCAKCGDPIQIVNSIGTCVRCDL